MKKLDLQQQLVDRVAVSSNVFEGTSCLLWTGPLFRSGHGCVSYQGRSQRIHRVVYELEYGPVPEGLDVDHKCHVAGECVTPNPNVDCLHRRCVNVLHLQAITSGENTLRGNGPTARHAAKTRCDAGHPFDDVNTYSHGTKGGRRCRTCYLEQKRVRYKTTVAVQHRFKCERCQLPVRELGSGSFQHVVGPHRKSCGQVPVPILLGRDA